MCKQLKEKLLQALMDNMGSVIDTLDEHAKSIKELEQRISQLSANGSGAERNKNIEFSMGSAAPGDRDRYDAANGIYYKFLDSEHPGTYIIAILKSPCEKGKMVMCYAFLIHESNNVETLYVADDTLPMPYSDYSMGFCNLIGRYASLHLQGTYKMATLTMEDVKHINGYIRKVGYTVDFRAEICNIPSYYSVSARLTRPLFKRHKHRHGKQGNK